MSKNKEELLNKAIDINPIGLIYSITATDCEEFLSSLFKKQGVEAYCKVAVSGNEKRPEVMCGVFINKNSNHIKTNNNNNNVADFLKKKMDSGLYYPDQQLSQLLKPLTKEVKLHLQGNQVVCLLDIFRVLGLMLMVDPRKHSINITEAKRIKSESVMIVWKTIKQQNNNFDANNDSASKTLAKLSRKY